MIAEPVETPTAILASAADLLREAPFDDISYRALADAVGVSERTVYRHFPTRSHLLEALAESIDATAFPLPAFSTIAQFRRAVRARFLAFDAAPAFAFVCARAASISLASDAEPTFQTLAIRAVLESAAPGLDARDLGRLAATLHSFSSAQFWARMRTGMDADASETADVFDQLLARSLSSLPAVSWVSV